VRSDTSVSVESLVGDADISSAMTAVISAAATEEPDSKSYSPPGRSVSTCCAGAPRVPARAGCSVPEAVMTPAMAVGKGASVPAAAPTKVTPRLRPACTSAVSRGSAGPAKLRFTSWLPAASAAAIARASVKVLQAAASLPGASCQHASNTSICARGAMPTMPMWLLATAAISPAIAVPCRSDVAEAARSMKERLCSFAPRRSG